MIGNFTFTIIKPCAFKAGHTGAILADILDAGYQLIAMKLTQMTAKEAGIFYAVHQERPFYGELVEFMSSGPIIVAMLSKENAVEDFRRLIGNTDPEKAVEGTLRKKYGQSLRYNAIHGSDSDENAILEASHFFAGFDQFRE